MNINYFPDEFSYHPHWKVSESHFAYWELAPTIDHINPIAQGGCDKQENWIPISMMHNAVKSNWILEQLQWWLYPVGVMKDWIYNSIRMMNQSKKSGDKYGTRYMVTGRF